MTAGEAGEHIAHFLPSVILGPCPGIQALPSLSSVRREARREHQPGFPPSARMTDWEAGENIAHFLPSVILGASPGIQALLLARLFFRRHSRALPGNPDPQPTPSQLEKMSTFNNGRLFLMRLICTEPVHRLDTSQNAVLVRIPVYWCCGWGGASSPCPRRSKRSVDGERGQKATQKNAEAQA